MNGRGAGISTTINNDNKNDRNDRKNSPTRSSASYSGGSPGGSDYEEFLPLHFENKYEVKNFVKITIEYIISFLK